MLLLLLLQMFPYAIRDQLGEAAGDALGILLRSDRNKRRFERYFEEQLEEVNAIRREEGLNPANVSTSSSAAAATQSSSVRRTVVGRIRSRDAATALDSATGAGQAQCVGHGSLQVCDCSS